MEEEMLRKESKDFYSLDRIIKLVFDDKGISYDEVNDPNVRRLRRAFEKMIERLGSDKEVFKRDGVFKFEVSEVPFMKTLLFQLDGNGIIADFTNRGKNKFSSKEVYEFLDVLKKEAEKVESSEMKEEMIDMVFFFY